MAVIRNKGNYISNDRFGFNDELLEKKQYSMTDVVETAFDENGVSLTEEKEEENEETKKSGLKR